MALQHHVICRLPLAFGSISGHVPVPFSVEINRTRFEISANMKKALSNVPAKASDKAKIIFAKLVENTIRLTTSYGGRIVYPYLYINCLWMSITFGNEYLCRRYSFL
jgi:hypothetical protein